MADITRTVAGPFIPQIWANTALEVLRNKVVLAKLVTRDSDIAAFQVGDTLNIPYPGTFTANDKAANGGVTPSDAHQHHDHSDAGQAQGSFVHR
jgi:hypothetical protein